MQGCTRGPWPGASVLLIAVYTLADTCMASRECFSNAGREIVTRLFLSLIKSELQFSSVGYV